MAINLEDFEFGKELVDGQVYVWRVTSVRPRVTKNGKTLRLNVGAAVAEGPSTGVEAYFPGYAFKVLDLDNPKNNASVWPRLFRDISKLTGIAVADLPKDLPEEENEATELVKEMLGKCFTAEAEWQEPQNGYDGKFQVGRVIDNVPEEDVIAPDFDALVE